MKSSVIKICTYCRRVLGEDNFSWRNKKKNIKHNYCKRCQRNYNTLWYKDNKEYINKQNKQWRENNKEYFKLYLKQWREDNKDKIREGQKQWRKDNLEYKKLHDKKYYKNNKDKRNKYSKQWYLDNKEQHKDKSAKWKQKNKGKVNSYGAKRHAKKLQAKIPWANQEIIAYIYEECAELNKLYPLVNGKPKFHIDHYYPLQSEFVCGLHHENNLHITTAKDNWSKSNKFPEEDIYLNRRI